MEIPILAKPDLMPVISGLGLEKGTTSGTEECCCGRCCPLEYGSGL